MGIYMSIAEEEIRCKNRELEDLGYPTLTSHHTFDLSDEFRNWLAFVIRGKKANKRFYKKIVEATPEFDLIIEEIMLDQKTGMI